MLTDLLVNRKTYNTQNHELISLMIDDFIKRDILPFHAEWEKNGMVSREIWKLTGEQGLLCIDVPEKYGGVGFDFTFSALFIEKLGFYGITGPGFSLHSDIVANYIVNYGTETQKYTYLPEMAKGTKIGAIAMTEPNCGSDLSSITTTAVDKGSHYIINGEKTFVTNGLLCDFAIVAVKTTLHAGHEGITLVLIDSNTEGFSKGTSFKKLGMHAQDTCSLFFDNVHVKKEQVLHGEGKGFQLMMNELARERLTIAIASIGAAKGAIEETLNYTATRKAFKKPIAGFQNTQFKLAECAAQLQIHQAFIDTCTELETRRELTPESAAIAKYSASEMSNKVVDECLQLFGGYGYMWEYPISRRFADNRISKIYGGTNEIMKILIAKKLYKGLI
ncbi:acyl-CoA dehydrogenase family protein [Kordia sp. YSTF-M3]|uniref:Acyl-CoA dehydrogenase family protein n=1 Tax=Kordia aestuariivivens TaxID=2759037 RepID=A0ABR7QGL2_9FLAO|nr:acyl-CoA dehydrogenase family protein [Kordia aestuariivivens]MBC8757648.1 acyl-CoA dehydrogenase family protein [Kordia aestuariivivens]